MSHPIKKLLAHPRGSSQAAARPLSVSLYPEHFSLLARLEADLNLHRSVIVQLLLETEERHGLTRVEAERRLAARNPKTCLA